MKRIVLVVLVALLVSGVVVSCKKESETFVSPPISDYFPMEVGRTYTYRLDSTVTFNFNDRLIVKSYHAKDSIESTFTDNQGRLSYRIFRFIRDTAGIQPWRFNSTFFATPTDKSMEYVDNNLRFIKMHQPIREGYSWKAHSYIDTKSGNTSLSYLDEWEYEYNNVGEDYGAGNKTYQNTITIEQQDETTPEGPFDRSLPFQERNFGVEVYAKGIGLVYKDLLHWTWQSTKYTDESFGIRLTLISHK